MNCRAARRYLSALAGEDLRPRRAEAVRAHLEACPACRREADEWREALSALQRAGQVPAAAVEPTFVWRGVRERLRRAETPPLRERIGLWRRPVPLPVAAGAIVLWAVGGAVLGLLLGRRVSPTPGPPGVPPGPPTPTAPPALARYQPVPQSPYALENVSAAEAGFAAHDLPWVSPRQEAPGEEFVLEEATFEPAGRKRVIF